MTFIYRISDLVILPNHQLARRIVALTLRANELSNAIQLSKEHMVHVRADKQKAIRIEKQHSQARMAEQKNHFESIVARHQGFIEQVGDFVRSLQLWQFSDTNKKWKQRETNLKIERILEVVHKV